MTEFDYGIIGTDLYTIETNDGQALHKPSRKAVREMVKKEIEYTASVESSGGNKYQAENDINDKNVELLTSILKETGSSSLAQEVSAIFAEERTAVNMLEDDARLKKLEDGEKKEFEESEENSKATIILSVVAVITVALVIMLSR